jgi:hypothetical protein
VRQSQAIKEVNTETEGTAEWEAVTRQPVNAQQTEEM